MREQTTIRLPGELLDALRREAEEEGRSFNGLNNGGHTNA